MARTALLVGATGLVGSQCLQQLLAHPEYARVRVLGRRITEHEHGKLETRLSELDDLDELGDFLTVDDVYCALGTTLKKAGSRAAFERVDYHMVVDTIRAARKAGARRVAVVSAAGTSAKSASFYSRVKARMEAAISDMDYEVVHILRPSLLMGDREELRPAERLGQLLAPVLGLFMRGPLAKYRPVQAATVATAMIELMLDPEAAGVHVHHLPLPAA